MATIKVTGINVLALYVTELGRSLEFYTQQLGFEKLRDMDPGVLLSAGELTVYMEGGRPVREVTYSQEFSPCLAVDSVEGAYDALSKAGVEMAMKYQEYTPEFAMFIVKDPDGLKVEFAGKP